MNAANDNESITSTNEVPVTSQKPALTSIEEPNLIATENGTTTDDSSQLYQQRDNSTAEAPDTAGSESNDTLILSQAVPDYTVYVVFAVALVSLIAMSLIFISVKNRK